jgi:hypothetical protein
MVLITPVKFGLNPTSSLYCEAGHDFSIFSSGILCSKAEGAAGVHN